jgi:hypothetical protein
VGLVAEAMRRAGFHPVPPGGYGLRALSVDALVPMRRPAASCSCRTMATFWRVSPVQAHLLVAAPDGFVHAHAGLGRVTFLLGPFLAGTREWRVLSERP